MKLERVCGVKMGNKLCKGKINEGVPVEVKENAIDRIMSRLCVSIIAFLILGKSRRS